MNNERAVLYTFYLCRMVKVMQHERRNISMLMDLYEMTMAHGYFTKQDNTDRVAFDVFYRRNPDKGGFAIFGGLEQVLEYILNLHFDEEDMAYFKSLHLFSDEFLEYLRNFKFTGDVYASKKVPSYILMSRL